MQRLRIIAIILVLITLAISMDSCRNRDQHRHESEVKKQQYRCPMHHEIVRDKPGTCPICGMDLVAFGEDENVLAVIDLNTLLKPTDNYVRSSIPSVSLEHGSREMEITALGVVDYDTRFTNSISSRVNGRIEKLYLKYTFQDVHRGQKVMDIYSPELLTAQENLLFLLQNDPTNSSLIQAAKERLQLSGVSSAQLETIIRQRKPSLTISVYSNYDGHIHDALSMNAPGREGIETGTTAIVTRELSLKEGMYVQQGQTLFSVFNPHRLWAVLSIYPEDQSFVTVGDSVSIQMETAPGAYLQGKINFIEPFFRESSKTLTARVYFENHLMNIPVGSQFKAFIRPHMITGNWLPKESVISLGIDQVVFKKVENGFKAQKISTGIVARDKIQVIGGLNPQDSVAANARFLMDSESFIKLNE